MSIWPWRSRPVITPFSDNYSGRVLLLGEDLPAERNDFYIPDNIYIEPSVVLIEVTSVGGFNKTGCSRLFFYRGGLLFAACVFPPIIRGSTWQYCLSATSTTVPPAAFCTTSIDPLPYPLKLYPNDRIEVWFPSVVAGDMIDLITIHGKTWEVH